MEILEKELEIEKKDNKLQTLLESLNNSSDYSDFLVLVLKVKYKNDFTNINMFGLKALDYIKSAISVCQNKVVDYNLEDDILKVVKQNLNDKKYVVVLFSDTPLIKKQTFLEILDYFKFKKLCALKFNRGFVFETEYLKSVDKVYNPQVQNFSEEDFYRVFDEKSFASCLEILKNRIISYHLNRGVIIKDINSTFIDAEVNIESGAIIEGNCVLLGKTNIKKDTIMSFGCKIKNSVIEENSFIENSIVENSLIKNNSKIIDFSIVKNVEVKANSIITNEAIRGE